MAELLKGISKMAGKLGKGSVDVQELKIPIPTSIVMKYLPQMLEDLKHFDEPTLPRVKDIPLENKIEEGE